MIKKFLAFLWALCLSAAFAAVDVNKANEAQLDGVKGLGPAQSKLILAERQKGEFKNWDDFIQRVKGMGEKRAAKLSAEGLTVGGAGYKTSGGKEAKAKPEGKGQAVAEEAKGKGQAVADAAKGKAEAKASALGDSAKDKASKAALPKADAAKM